MWEPINVKVKVTRYDYMKCLINLMKNIVEMYMYKDEHVHVKIYQ